MNLDDVLKYGHQTVMNSIKGLDESDCLVGGVCGHWSVRDILAHLASDELLLLDAMNMVLGKSAWPNLDNYLAQGYTLTSFQGPTVSTTSIPALGMPLWAMVGLRARF